MSLSNSIKRNRDFKGAPVNYEFILAEKVKKFVEDTLKDASTTFNYSQKKVGFLDRLRKRVGNKLLNIGKKRNG